MLLIVALGVTMGAPASRADGTGYYARGKYGAGRLSLVADWSYTPITYVSTTNSYITQFKTHLSGPSVSLRTMFGSLEGARVGLAATYRSIAFDLNGTSEPYSELIGTLIMDFGLNPKGTTRMGLSLAYQSSQLPQVFATTPSALTSTQLGKASVIPGLYFESGVGRQFSVFSRLSLPLTFGLTGNTFGGETGRAQSVYFYRAELGMRMWLTHRVGLVFSGTAFTDGASYITDSDRVVIEISGWETRTGLLISF